MFELFNNESTAETILPGFCDKYVRVAKLQDRTKQANKIEKRSTRIITIRKAASSRTSDSPLRRHVLDLGIPIFEHELQDLLE